MFFGLFLLLIGLMMLLEKFGLLKGDFWDYVWPALLVALGLAMIFKRKPHLRP